MTKIENNQFLQFQPGLQEDIPVIAGFWRRLLAAIIDIVIISVFCQLISLLFPLTLYKLGPYASPLGLLVVLPYYGILNSKIGQGWTIGKRILNLEVRSKDNQYLSIYKSFLRTSLLFSPLIINCFGLLNLENSFVIQTINFLLYSIYGLLIYTMVFNKATRQGFHDMILGTYVVDLRKETNKPYNETPKKHWIISFAWIGFVLVFIMGFNIFQSIKRNSTTFENTIYQTFKSINEEFKQNPNTITSSISEQTRKTTKTNLYSTQETESWITRSLVLDIWINSKLDFEEMKNVGLEYIRIVITDFPNIDNYDLITIRIKYGFSLGFTYKNFTTTWSGSPYDWRSLLNLN